MLSSFLNYLKESFIFAICSLTLMTLTSMIATFLLGSNIQASALSVANQDELRTLLFDTPVWIIALSGFEDVIFVYPLLLLSRVRSFNPNYILVPLIMVFAVMFSLGHSYQGAIGVLAKIGYVPFALWYAKKYGISRTITGHAMQDVMVVTFARLMM